MRLLRSKATGNVVVLALLGLWFVTLAPIALKGPAAYIEVVGHSMDGTYRTGDLVITRSQDSYEKGDILAFRVGRDGRGGQVIHRVIGGNGVKGYRMQGDNNPDPDPWRPTDADVIGKAWIHLDQKAYLMHLPRNPTFAGITAGLVTLLVLGLDARPKRRQEPAAPAPVLTDADSNEPVLVSDSGERTVPGDPARVPSQRTPAHERPHVDHRGPS
jgi:signal peptidase